MTIEGILAIFLAIAGSAISSQKLPKFPETIFIARFAKNLWSSAFVASVGVIHLKMDYITNNVTWVIKYTALQEMPLILYLVVSVFGFWSLIRILFFVLIWWKNKKIFIYTMSIITIIVDLVFLLHLYSIDINI